MNTLFIIGKLQRQYPGKRIMKNNEENPTEIICEIDPTNERHDFSIAVSVIDSSIPHYHKKSTEVYEVMKGNLVIQINGKDVTLNTGEQITIHPGQIHSAKGNETWIKATSRPGWTKDDHYLVTQEA